VVLQDKLHQYQRKRPRVSVAIALVQTRRDAAEFFEGPLDAGEYGEYADGKFWRRISGVGILRLSQLLRRNIRDATVRER